MKTASSGDIVTIEDAEKDLADTLAILDEEEKASVKKDATVLERDLTLAECGDDLERWAGEIETLLSTEHFCDVQKVKMKTKNCSKCKSDAGCLKCWWPLAVRHWRNLETKGRYAEGYTGSGRAKALKIGMSKMDMET